MEINNLGTALDENEGINNRLQPRNESITLSDENRPTLHVVDNITMRGDHDTEQGSEFSRGDDSEEDFEFPGVNDLPLFATAEARKLDVDNKGKEAQIERLVGTIDDLTDRVKIMKEHFRNVQQEVEHTNALASAKKSEMHAEEHLTQLTSRTLGRAQNEARRIYSEIQNAQEIINTTQNNLRKESAKLDEFKMQMNWNQEELEKWVIASKQKDEDNLVLLKYTSADELKIKEKSREKEHLTGQLLKLRADLEGEVSDTQSKQVELDRLAVDFRDIHIERQNFIHRWQETIEEMKKRDNNINELGGKYATAKIERGKKENMLLMAQKRFEAQHKENVEVEQKSDLLSRLVSKKREEMLKSHRRLADFRDEMESLKSELTASAENLVSKRTENAHKAHDLDEKKISLQRQRDKYASTKQKLETARNQNNKSEEVAKFSEDKLICLEKEFEKHVGKLKVERENLIKETQKLFDLRAEEGRFRGDISGTKSTFKTLDVNLQALDKEAAKQQELLYNAEFQIQQIERKIARGMGERSDDEKRELKRRINDLEAQRDSMIDKKKVLLSQVRKLSNELGNAKTRRTQLADKLKEKTELQGELELQNRMVEDQIRKETKVKEDLIVNNDLLRLEVRRLRDLLSAKADAVFSLENRKEQLELSLAERKEEINVHRDVLRAELRVANEDRHKVTMDLRIREANVEKLRSRFEAITKAKGSNDEGHSQAYYVILAAQRREGLQRKGDELDYDVRKAEKEIRALQTTMDHLNARNKAYRASFQRIDLTGDDSEVLKQLEERLKLGKEGLFKKKKELQRLVTDLDEDARRLQQTTLQNDHSLREREELEMTRIQIEDNLLSQQGLMEELRERMKKISFKHREEIALTMDQSGTILGSGSIQERAVRAEVFKDLVQNILYTLGQLSSEFPEVADYLLEKTMEADLRIPVKPPSRLGTTTRGHGNSLGLISNENIRPTSGVGSSEGNFDIEL